jgi:glutathione S-transferase
MKLYNSMGPNPHIVRMFAAELGVSLELIEIDLMAGENRESAYLARNPAGQLPALELDDGEIIAESTAICEYLDETSTKTLLGDTAAERAQTRMWTRRLDLSICEPMLNGFRYSEGLPIFQNRMIMIPEAAAGLKNVAQDRLAWLDQQMADGRQFIVGERVTLADVFLYCMLTFGKAVGQPMSSDHTHIAKWYEHMAARPSAEA